MKKIGLALGGGVVRGFAHVGVLMALEEAGIQVDVVTGTSVGSIVGAFVAAGYDARSTAEVATHISWRGMARVAWPGRGGWLSFYKLEQFVRAELRNARIEELKLPFAAVATDLATGNPVVLTEGPVARAVHASSAVPGVVCPVVIDGQFLSDGGVSDNLPVRTTRALGAEYVIACNILGRYWSRASNPVSRAVAAVENAIRWAGGGLLYADCLIEPDVADVAYQSFSKREYMVSQGRRATERKIPEILRAIQAGETPAPTQVQREIARGLEKAAEAA